MFNKNLFQVYVYLTEYSLYSHVNILQYIREGNVRVAQNLLLVVCPSDGNPNNSINKATMICSFIVLQLYVS